MSTDFLPELNLVAAKHAELFRKFTSTFKPYSDFSLLSLLTWNNAGANAFCLYENNLVIRITDYLSSECVFSILGNNNIDKVVSEFMHHEIKLKCIPEEVYNQVSNKQLLTQDRDSFDYIIDVQSHSLEKPGGKYKTYNRNVYNFFSRYPLAKVVELNLNQAFDSDRVFKLVTKWCELKNFGEEEKDENLKKIEIFIENSDFFDTYNLGLVVAGDLIACTLNEIVSDDWSIGHFGYSLLEFQNSSYALEHLGTLELQKKGLKYLNMEQDTGLQGLRTYKMNLVPSFFLKKYTSITSDKQESSFPVA